MRFSLQDVKKQVYRRAGEPYLALHWLRPGELQGEMERLVAYHEQLLGQPRRAFSLDEARACIGDDRLADCLVAVLGAWYSWSQPDWATVIAGFAAPAASLAALERAGITSPSALRLALFDYVNTQYAGFLAYGERAEALGRFAASLALQPGELEALLTLDSAEEARLQRLSSAPPAAGAVATLYNQTAFEAALYASSQVDLVLDCLALRDAHLAGVGAIVKRLCYLARRLGVYYDLYYEREVPAAAQGEEGLLLHLTLYGPQEMTGLPQQYGQRLARLCRLLFSYAGAVGTEAGGGTGPRRRGRAREARRLRRAIVEARATVHLGTRAFSFALDAQVLALLEAVPTADEEPLEKALSSSSAAGPGDEAVLFDSSVESAFAGAFHALERGQGVDGWHLEREPEPLLLEHSIFIPDFALSRGRQRVYIEILGFWTPTYRQRKIEKLQQLQARDDIVLMIPQEARAAFDSLAALFPIVWYDGQVAISDLLTLLRSRYDDFAMRLAALDVAGVSREVHGAGLICERDCYTLLHCYRRAELQRAAARLGDAELRFTPGVGLYTQSWFEHFAASFVEWMGERSSVALSEVLTALRLRWPQLAAYEDTMLESLLSLIEGVTVQHRSMFEAMVEYGGALSVAAAETEAESGESTVKRARRPLGQGAARRPKAAAEPEQPDLWT